MLFRKTQYVHSREAKQPKVLALYSSHFIGEIRIKPYLNALLGRGVIGDYQIADRAMKTEGQHGDYAFTHIWCQRNVSTAQFAFLKKHSHVPIVYDMDDLLTSIPDFVASSRRTMLKRVAWCLQKAKAVTVASENLKRYLAEDAPRAANKIIVLKNGWMHSPPPERRSSGKHLIWTSSDVPFFLRENPSFAGDLATLLHREGFEAILIGRFDENLRKLFGSSRYISHLDFWSYREYLRTLAGGIAIAPMPSRLPAQAQRYFDAKSDVKLIDYLTSGLIPIVSHAAPYATSELFIPELAAAGADEMLRRIEASIADRDGLARQINGAIHQNGLLRRREFSELSKPLDSLFARAM